VVTETTPSTDQLLSVLREYSGKLSEHSRAFDEMKWTLLIRLLAFFSLFGIIAFGSSLLESQYSYRIPKDYSAIISIAILLVAVTILLQFVRSYSRLHTQIRRELYLSKRLLTRASEILDQSPLSVQGKFVYEISLFEAEQAVAEAQKSLRRAFSPVREDRED
jgi:hypothetical protein